MNSVEGTPTPFVLAMIETQGNIVVGTKLSFNTVELYTQIQTIIFMRFTFHIINIPVLDGDGEFQQWAFHQHCNTYILSN